MKLLVKVDLATDKLENNRIIHILRHGFAMAVPFLMIGAFALMFYSFPLNVYQSFIKSFLNGFLGKVFNTIYSYTLGSISLILIATISLAFRMTVDKMRTGIYSATALAAYCMYVGDANAVIDFSVFSPSWTLTAVIITMVSCSALHFILNMFSKKLIHTSKYFDTQKSGSTVVLGAVSIVLTVFALLGILVRNIDGGSGFQNIFGYIMERMFSKLGRNFGSASLFMLMVHLMWCFGIHGNNVLDNVSRNLFQGGMAINQSNIEAGLKATEIYTKAFMDNFILMGGSGCALGLLIAILLVSKNKSKRRIGKASIVSAIFNINEPIIFGYPIIFNPIMFIPYILTPLVLLLNSTIFIKLGIVPITTHTVEWTTPIILSGYLATGSVTGSILQIINLGLSILIYIPFVKIFEKPNKKTIVDNINKLTDQVYLAEESGVAPKLLEGTSTINFAAQRVLNDFYEAVEADEINLFYQPQINDKGEIIGAEGLLRWNNYNYGYVSPPLIIALTNEDNYGDKLGMFVIERACRDLHLLNQKGFNHFKMSVNISPKQLENVKFTNQLSDLLKKYDIGNNKLALEITERNALSSVVVLEKTMEKINNLGIELIMDDFGMGHNSMIYMQNCNFSMVKIDGNLVKDIISNERSREIIETVCSLAKKLGFKVVAEFVEEQEQRDILCSLGCHIYQGYLYGKAMPMEQFLEEYKFREANCAKN